MTANDFNHNATIGYNNEQVELSIRVHALQEAVKVVEVVVGGSVSWREVQNNSVTTNEVASKVIAVAKQFEEYLKAESVEE